jgi:hypothetical protein
MQQGLIGMRLEGRRPVVGSRGGIGREGRQDDRAGQAAMPRMHGCTAGVSHPDPNTKPVLPGGAER